MTFAKDAGLNQTAERRQITVMFCDLVDSVSLSQRCDPEDLRSIIHLYHRECGATIARNQGQVVQFLGDGIMAQFGFPLAAEDSARAAVRAALAFRAVLPALNEKLANAHGEQIRFRIGIHTGLAIVGRGADGTRVTEIIGDTPNVAARLQGLAPPNEVVISEATRRVLRESFQLMPLGDLELKGLQSRVRVFQVLSERPIEQRLRTRREMHEGIVVGRAAETAELAAAWRAASTGQGRVALITGEPGIGKSRLCSEVCEQEMIPEESIFIVQSSAEHQNAPFYPIVEHLEHRIGIRREDSASANLTRLRTFLARLDLDTDENALLFGHFLKLPVVGGPAIADPDEARRRTRDALVELLLRRAAAGPCLCVFEDMHWADPSTMEVLQRVIDRVGAVSLLLLLTSRTTHAQLGTEKLVRIPLYRLSDEDSLNLATQLGLDTGLAPEICKEVVRRSDGVPLFVEELTAALVQTGSLASSDGRAPLEADSRIPAAIYDSLMVRLDRLGTARGIAQVASVIGREFWRAMLFHVAGESLERLEAALSQLTDAGIIFAGDREGEYVFKHALVRDIAYESLLKAQRRELHGKIAKAITEHFPELATLEPDYLAQHLTEAGAGFAAVRQWLVAASQSIRRSANLEAIAQGQRALDILGRMPAGRERDDLELSAQLALLSPRMAAVGYAAPAVADGTQRALDLVRTFENDPRTFPVLYGRWTHLQFTGNAREARVHATEFLELAKKSGLRPATMVGHRLLGSTLLVAGQAENAKVELLAALDLYKADEDRAMAFSYGTDPYVMSLAHLSITAWMLGDLDAAESYGRDASERAWTLKHHNTLGYAVGHVCIVNILRREPEQVQREANRFMFFAAERQLPFWSELNQAFLAWCACQEDLAAGIAGLERQLATFRAINLAYWVPTYICWLAEAQARAGDRATAQASLLQARELMERGGEVWYEAEAWRLEGVLLADDPATRGRAKPVFERALTLAKRRNQVMLALRAATSLHRLEWSAASREALDLAVEPVRNHIANADVADALALL